MEFFRQCKLKISHLQAMREGLTRGSALRDTRARPLVGNPPKNPSVVKVEISMKEFLHEKKQIHRQPDHGCIEAC
jgi:hypothetical protein